MFRLISNIICIKKIKWQNIVCVTFSKTYYNISMYVTNKQMKTTIKEKTNIKYILI